MANVLILAANVGMAVGGYGGAERSLKLAESMPQHNVTVLMTSTGNDNKSITINNKLRLVHINEDARTNTLISTEAKRRYAGNLDIATYAMSDRLVRFKEELKRTLKTTDLVILDHVGAVSLIKGVQIDVPILYASHNCETSLAEQMYPRLKDNISKIREMEESIIGISDMITYCSHEDIDKMKSLFTVDVPTKYIPNGTDQRSFIRSDTSRSKSIIFIGSGHPPNVEAAQRLIPVARALPNFEFNIIGKCGNGLDRSMLPPNMRVLGHVSEDQMDDLFKNSFAFINPMLNGSGTHLKVMRAMSYGIPIISSDVGLRGFTPEEIDGTMVVANTDSEMVDAISNLGVPKVYRTFSSNTLKLAKSYYWDTIQADFCSAVDQMLDGVVLKPELILDKKKILIYSIVRDNAKYVDRYHKQLASIVSSFGSEYDFYLSIYENDSVDGTAQKLMAKDWSMFNGVSIITERIGTQSFGSVKAEERVKNLSFARNKAIEAAGFIDFVDYVLMTEGDNEFTTDSVSKLLKFGEKEKDFDVVSAVSIRNNGTHYDWWATRKTPIYQRGHSEIPRNFARLDYDKYFSTSNGLCLYNAEAFRKGARHGWINDATGLFDCEMVVLCQEFRKLGHDKIFINYQSKSHHDV